MPDTVISTNSKLVSRLFVLAPSFGVTRPGISTWVVCWSTSSTFGCGSTDSGGTSSRGMGRRGKVLIPIGGVEGGRTAGGGEKATVPNAGVGGGGR